MTTDDSDDLAQWLPTYTGKHHPAELVRLGRRDRGILARFIYQVGLGRSFTEATVIVGDDLADAGAPSHHVINNATKPWREGHPPVKPVVQPRLTTSEVAARLDEQQLVLSALAAIANHSNMGREWPEIVAWAAILQGEQP